MNLAFILSLVIILPAVVVLSNPVPDDDYDAYDYKDEDDSYIAASSALSIEEVKNMVQEIVKREEEKKPGTLAKIVDEIDLSHILLGMVNGSVELSSSLRKVARDYYAKDEDLRLDVTFDVSATLLFLFAQ